MSTTRSDLSYAFARDKGLVVLDRQEDQVRVAVRHGADPFSLIEARRVLRRPLTLEAMGPQDFERALTEHYAREGVSGDEAEAALDRQGGLASLVDGIPETADLLDGDDDAPVIRLIASAAIIVPMMPGNGPRTPAAAQLGASSGAGSVGNRQL